MIKFVKIDLDKLFQMKNANIIEIQLIESHIKGITIILNLRSRSHVKKKNRNII